MILANVDWLSISITLLLIVFVITCLLMSLLILMQRPKQEGLGAAFGSGMTDQMFGARTTNVLQRGTVYLASLFFVLTITLAILFARKNERQYSLKKDEPIVVEEIVEETPALEEDAPAPSLEDELESSPVNSGESTEAEEAPATEEAPTEEAPTEEEPAEEEAEVEPAEETPAEDEDK
ncbi:preprotein translocase subunit SecG [Haloferula sp.]|uniref:preprotein translocase subunit SecG n=1 Tax=Haloferula sp. TaxID=2497595 RepID=UPI00329C20B7